MDRSTTYRIRVRGRLGPEWGSWFGGLAVEAADGDEAVLSGELPDQAALHGVLGRIRDLGVPLLAVESVESVESVETVETVETESRSAARAAHEEA